MKKLLIFSMLMVALLIFSFATSQAVMIGFDTSPKDVNVLDTFTVDLMVSGLGNYTSPSLGAFDVDILYDTSQMTFLSWALGTHLGDVSLFEALDVSTGDMNGIIDLAEVSFLAPDDLTNNQPEAFSLAFLSFRCVSLGISSIAIDGADTFLYLGDENGDPLDVTVGDPVTVNQTGQVPIPEPSTIALLGIGLAGLGFFRRNKK